MPKLSSAVIQAAQDAQRRWGVPASVSLAQYGLESGWGKHIPPGSNNPFGIKRLADLPSVTAGTQEVFHGRTVAETQPFAVFPSIAASFDAHAKLIATAKVYAAAMAALPDVRKFVDLMAAKYATDPHYATKLLLIMQSGKLYAYNTVQRVQAVANSASASYPPLSAIPSPGAALPIPAPGSPSEAPLSNPSPIQQPPSMVTQTITLLLRHGLTMLGTVLVSWGAVDKSQSQQLIGLAAGAGTIAAGLLWSYLEKNTKTVWITQLLEGIGK